MSDASKAIFLSYASQDAEAAKRICDALRAAGIEVWFDQSELRGGDSWDAKIRKQIRECALFVPIISANTQARGEGYFRREWKMAVERTHDMGDHIPFLLPVTIDGTTEREAFVPEAFLKVQWSRVPNGEVSESVVMQVKRLLGASDSVGPALAPRREESGRHAASGGPTIRRRFPIEIAVLATVLVVAGLGFWYFQKTAIPKEPGAKSQELAATTAALPPIPNDKSIAILPFENMSDDKEKNTVFTDGMQDAIITKLINIRDLRVATQDAVMEYRGTTKKFPQIARELGVAYLLTGSVWRSGDKVRITGKLIPAGSSGYLWGKDYNRELTTKDIFEIQAAISTEIADALSAVISPEARKIIESRPTENLAAYDLYLTARTSPRTPGRFKPSLDLLEEAVRLDPRFGEAWRELSYQSAYAYFFGWDRSSVRLERVRTALESARRLSPESPDILQTEAYYYYYGLRDYPRAIDQVERLLRLRPNVPSVYRLLGALQRRQGKWLESTTSYKKALSLEITSKQSMDTLAQNYFAGRRYDDLVAIMLTRLQTLRAGASAGDDGAIQDAEYSAALAAYEASGSRREVEAYFAGMAGARAESPRIIAQRKSWAGQTGNFAEAVRLDRIQPFFEGDETAFRQAVDAAMVLAATGDMTAAQARLGDYPDQIKARLAAEPDNSLLIRNLSLFEAVRGNKAEALRLARLAQHLVPESLDRNEGPANSYNLACVLAWTGEKEASIAEIARLLQIPAINTPSVHVLRTSAETFPLHGDLRFETLLNDPKNNAPLF